MKRVMVCMSIVLGSLWLGAGCATEEGVDDDAILGERSDRRDPQARCEQRFTCARDGVVFVGEIYGEDGATPAEARLECREHCGQGCEASGLSCVPQPEK